MSTAHSPQRPRRALVVVIVLKAHFHRHQSRPSLSSLSNILQLRAYILGRVCHACLFQVSYSFVFNFSPITMALRPDVLQAFSLLDIDPSSTIDTAAKAYKRKAFLHHPDRNRGDSDATRRFQEVRSRQKYPPQLLFSQHQPRRSALPGISARDISTILHGDTKPLQQSPTSFLRTMTFLWTKTSSTTFTCTCLRLAHYFIFLLSFSFYFLQLCFLRNIIWPIFKNKGSTLVQPEQRKSVRIRD